MTQLDSEAWLERAREALAPREADQSRVLAALEKQLHLPPNGPGIDAERLNRVEVSSGIKKLSLFKSAVARWTVSAVVPLAGVAAISVFVATRSPSAPSAPPPAKRPVAAAVTQTSLPEAIDLALAQAEITEPKPVERAVDAAPAPKKPARKKCRAADGSERPCAPAKPRPSAVASAPPPTAAPASSLSKELAALREAQQALRKGQPAQALELLTRFEREQPGPGAMQEERNAAATMARCALNGASSELYAEFTQRYPNSAYAARVRRICSPKQ